MNPVLDFALLDEDATAGYLLKHASAVSQDTRLIASSFSATLGLLYLERQAPRIGGEASTMSSQALTALDQRLCTDFDASLDELDPVAILQWTSPQLIAYAYELMAQPHRLDPDLADCLALIALSDLRKYRFDTACTLLCALLCCGCRSAYLDDGMAFIRLQRRSNGSYGHVNMLNKKNVIPDDLDRQFHLPFTVHALAVQDAGLRSLPSGGAA